MFMLTLIALLAAQDLASGPLNVGWASRDITPDKPVALAGQFHKRISKGVAARLSLTALALESRGEQAILVSCDLVAIHDGLLARLRKLLEGKLEGFDLRKLLLSATHTHTAPVTLDPWYDVVEDGVMKPEEYVDFLLARAAEAPGRGASAGPCLRSGGANADLPLRAGAAGRGH